VQFLLLRLNIIQQAMVFMDGMVSLYSNKLVSNEIDNVNEANILQADKELILKFGTKCKARQLSDSRTRKYLWHLRKIAEVTPSLNEGNKDSIDQFLSWLEQQPLSEHTKSDYRITLSVFYKWIEAEELGMTTEDLVRQRLEPKLIMNLKVKSKNKQQKLPEQLLTEEEILLLIQNASNPRDKAFIAMLFESGARISELGTLQIKNITFIEQGMAIQVDGKTGPRRIFLVTSKEYLKNWLNQHPDVSNPEAPLWIGDYLKQQIKYSMFRKILIQTAKKAKIIKPINPHQFRHSRATILAQHLTEQQLKVYLGWTPDSKMAGVYVHIKQVDDAILNMYGMKIETQEQTKMLSRKCICGTENEPTIQFCKQCQAPLTSEALHQYEEKKETQHELKLKEFEIKLEVMNQIMQKIELIQNPSFNK
jgi:integrase/recombinase XerD